MAWEETSSGHDVDLSVGAWLGAHAYLRLGWLTRISWEWVACDGNGNPDRAAIVLHTVEESLASKTGAVRRDRHHRQCSSSACSSSATRTESPLEPPHRNAGSILVSLSPSLPRSRNGPRGSSVLRHMGVSADAWTQRRSQTEI